MGPRSMETARDRPVRAVLVILLAGLGIACGGDPVPGSLLGTWRTDAPLYANRPLRVEPDTIRFGTGDGEFASHPIEGVRRVEARGAGEEEGEGIAYEITYGSGGRTYRLALYWRRSGLLVFRNQPGLEWRRVELPGPAAR